MNCFKRLQRFFSGVVAVLFFVTSTFVPAPVAYSQTVENLPKFFDGNSFQIPAEFGKVTEIIPASPSGDMRHTTSEGQVLIHIREAHANYDAQTNIKKILEYLSQNYGVKLILLEGAGNKLQPGLFNFFPKDAGLQQAVNDELMRAGELTGAEVFLIDQRPQTAGHSPKSIFSLRSPVSGLQSGGEAAEAFGIENAKAYADDREAYRKVHEGQKLSEAFLAAFFRQWQKAADRALNKPLREFLDRESAFEDKRLPLQDWAVFLKTTAARDLNIDLENVREQRDWPALVRYFRLKKIGSQIDPAKALKEKEAFLKDLRTRKVPGALLREITTLLEYQNAGDLPLYKTRFAFERLMDLLPKDYSFEPYPVFRIFLQQLILLSELQNERFQEEIRALTRKAAEGLIKTKQEKQLAEVFHDYRLLGKLFRLELSREEYEQIKSRKITPEKLVPGLQTSDLRPETKNGGLQSRVSGLESLFAAALDFYSGAILREDPMMQNAMKILAGRKDKKAVLITGGFHTEGFKEKIVASGSSYIGITPNIGEIRAEDEKNYLDALLGKGAVRSLTDRNKEPRRISSPESRGPVSQSSIAANPVEDLPFMVQTSGRRFLAQRLANIRQIVAACLQEKFLNAQDKLQEHREMLDQGIQGVIRGAVGERQPVPVSVSRSEARSKDEENISGQPDGSNRQEIIFIGARSGVSLDSQERVILPKELSATDLREHNPLVVVPEKDGALRVYLLETWKRVVEEGRPRDESKAKEYYEQVYGRAFLSNIDRQRRIYLGNIIKRGFLDSSTRQFDITGAGKSLLIKPFSPRSEARTLATAQTVERSEMRSRAEENVPELADYTVVSRQLEAGLSRDILEELKRRYNEKIAGLVAATTVTGGLGALMHDLFPSWQKNFGAPKKKGIDAFAVNVIYDTIKGQAYAKDLPEEVVSGQKTLGDYLREVLTEDPELRLSFFLDAGDEFRAKAGEWINRAGDPLYKKRLQQAREAVDREIQVKVHPTETLHGGMPNFYIEAFYIAEDGTKVQIFDEVYPDAPGGSPNLWRDLQMGVYGKVTELLTLKLQEQGVVKKKILFVDNEVFVSLPTPLLPEALHHHMNHSVYAPTIYQPDEASLELLGYSRAMRPYIVRDGKISIVDAVGISFDLVTGVALYEHTPAVTGGVMPGYVESVDGYNQDGLRSTNGVLFEQWQAPFFRSLLDQYKEKVGLKTAASDKEFFDLINPRPYRVYEEDEVTYTLVTPTQDPQRALLMEEFKNKAELIKAYLTGRLMFWLKESQNKPAWFDQAMKAYQSEFGPSEGEDSQIVEDLAGRIQKALENENEWAALLGDPKVQALQREFLKIPIVSNVRRQVVYKGPAKWLEILKKLKADPEKLVWYKENAARAVIGGREFGPEAHDLFLEIQGLVQELGLEGQIVTIENYNIDVAPVIFQGVSGTVMLSYETLEASATSMMKGLPNGAVLIGVWGGAEPELFTILETATGREVNIFKENVTYEEMIEKLHSGIWKITNGFLVEYSVNGDGKFVLNTLVNGKIKKVNARFPVADSLFDSLVRLQERYQIPSERRGLIWEALRSSPKVDMEKSQARAHMKLWQRTIQKVEKAKLLKNSGLSPEQAAKFLSPRDGETAGFIWRNEETANPIESALPGPLGFVESARQIRTHAVEGYRSVAHHSTQGDILKRILHYLEGFESEAPDLSQEILRLKAESDAIADPLEKVRINFTAMRLFDRFVVQLSGSVLQGAVGPKGVGYEELFRNPLFRRNLHFYLESKGPQFDSLNKNLVGFVTLLGDEKYIVALNLGEPKYPGIEGGEPKAWGELYGQQVFSDLTSQSDPESTQAYQIVDAITGEVYGMGSERKPYLFWMLAQGSLRIGVPSSDVQILKLQAVGKAETDGKRDQSGSLILDDLRALVSGNPEEQVRQHRPRSYWLKKTIKHLQEGGPEELKEHLQSVSGIGRDRAVSVFGAEGVRPVMALVATLAPELLDEMKEWDPEVYEALKGIMQAPEMKDLFEKGEVSFHDASRGTAIVLSRVIRAKEGDGESNRHVVVPIHFSQVPYNKEEGKVWFGIGAISQLGLDPDKAYQVREFLSQAVYERQHTLASFKKEGWRVGIPVVTRKDSEGATQLGWRFQVLQAVPVKEVSEPSTQENRSEAREPQSLGIAVKAFELYQKNETGYADLGDGSVLKNPGTEDSQVLLVKASTGPITQKTIAEVLRSAESLGHEVNAVHVISPEDIRRQNIFATHYPRHAAVAYRGRDVLTPNEESALDAYLAATGFSGKVFSAAELMKEFKLSAEVLGQIWKQGKARKFQEFGARAFRVGIVVLPDGSEAAVLNGFVPALREDFEKGKNPTVALWLKKNSKVSSANFLKDMRNKLAGDTDPAVAAGTQGAAMGQADSLRARAFRHDPALDLPENFTPDNRKNFIHLTDPDDVPTWGPGEGEFHAWFGDLFDSGRVPVKDAPESSVQENRSEVREPLGNRAKGVRVNEKPTVELAASNFFQTQKDPLDSFSKWLDFVTDPHPFEGAVAVSAIPYPGERYVLSSSLPGRKERFAEGVRLLAREKKIRLQNNITMEEAWSFFPLSPLVGFGEVLGFWKIVPNPDRGQARLTDIDFKALGLRESTAAAPVSNLVAIHFNGVPEMTAEKFIRVHWEGSEGIAESVPPGRRPQDFVSITVWNNRTLNKPRAVILPPGDGWKNEKVSGQVTIRYRLAVRSEARAVARLAEGEIVINPSLLAVQGKNEQNLIEKAVLALQAQKDSGVKTPWLHFDVIQSGENGSATAIVKAPHVEETVNLFTPDLLQKIKAAARAEGITANIDVHLMVMESSEGLILRYKDSGADLVTLHWEAYGNEALLAERLHFVKKQGIAVGLAFNPNASIANIERFIFQYKLEKKIDLLLPMTVYPGAGGQKFMIQTLDSIRRLRIVFPNAMIEADGGIEPLLWARQAVKAGANVLVPGTAFFGKREQDQKVFGQNLGALNASVQAGLKEIGKNGPEKLNESERGKYASALKALEKVKEAIVAKGKSTSAELFVLGLGSGTTMWDYFLPLLGEAIARGEIPRGAVVGVGTSPRTEAICDMYGIRLDKLDKLITDANQRPIDIAIDGADEIDEKFFGIKGGGGALTDEKPVIDCAKDVIIIVDSTKMKKTLGEFLLPLEVEENLKDTVMAQLEQLGGKNPKVRTDSQGIIFRPGNRTQRVIVDVDFNPIVRPAQLAAKLEKIPGVVTQGIFFVKTPPAWVIVGKKDGTAEALTPPVRSEVRGLTRLSTLQFIREHAQLGIHRFSGSKKFEKLIESKDLAKLVQNIAGQGFAYPAVDDLEAFRLVQTSLSLRPNAPIGFFMEEGKKDSVERMFGALTLGAAIVIGLEGFSTELSQAIREKFPEVVQIEGVKIESPGEDTLMEQGKRAMAKKVDGIIVLNYYNDAGQPVLSAPSLVRFKDAYPGLVVILAKNVTPERVKSVLSLPAPVTPSLAFNPQRSTPDELIRQVSEFSQAFSQARSEIRSEEFFKYNQNEGGSQAGMLALTTKVTDGIIPLLANDLGVAGEALSLLPASLTSEDANAFALKNFDAAKEALGIKTVQPGDAFILGRAFALDQGFLAVARTVLGDAPLAVIVQEAKDRAFIEKFNVGLAADKQILAVSEEDLSKVKSDFRKRLKGKKMDLRALLYGAETLKNPLLDITVQRVTSGMFQNFLRLVDGKIRDVVLEIQAQFAASRSA